MSNVIVRQSSAPSDGSLSSAEYSMWVSTMKLQEDEAHPTLKESHFVTLTTHLPAQVSFSSFVCMVAFFDSCSM